MQEQHLEPSKRGGALCIGSNGSNAHPLQLPVIMKNYK